MSNARVGLRQAWAHTDGVERFVALGDQREGDPC